MNVATEEDQRCRVAFICEQHLGRSLIGIQFSGLAQELWHVDDPASQNFNASAAGAFWER